MIQMPGPMEEVLPTSEFSNGVQAGGWHLPFLSSGKIGLWGALGAGLGSWKFKVASELVDITARWLVHSRHGFDFRGN